MCAEGADALPLDDQRAALRASTTGHTVQVPLDTYHTTFHNNILSSKRATDALISSVEEGLKTAKFLNETGWRDTELKPGVKEDDTYRGLEPIAEKIHDLCMAWNEKKKKTPKLPERTTRLICRPNHVTHSEVRGGSMKTDARFILIKSSDGGGKVDDKKVSTSDVPSVGEAKLQVKDRGTNENQVVGAVSHILFNDPCRRFVLSFTVEGNMMRFWYFSRSLITVSAEFDYHKNPRDLIRFIIFMMFSPLEKLGYDPTVVRVRDEDNKIQYQFTVGDTKYQTVRCIDEASALDIVTRATRVWAVQELDADNQPSGDVKVLKDVWLYCNAKSEKDIQDEIFTALRELDKIGVPEDQRPPTSSSGATMAEDAKQYFMTIEHDVPVQIDCQDDTTVAPPTDAVEFCYTPLPSKAAAKRTTVEGSRRTEYEAFAAAAASTGGRKASAKPQPTARPAQNPPVYPHTQRTHRRIVFAEECQTLYVVDNYGDLALGLAQLVYGLDYMRLAGFIHRDISPGNCLLFMKGRHIKISDLEYARRYDSQCQSTLPLTGTPGFMAVEYQALRHHFLKKPDMEKQPSMQDLEDEEHQNSWFRFNFLHDLESVLWILLSHLLTTVPNCLHADDKDTVARHKAVLELYDQLFDGSLKGSMERQEFIRNIADSVMDGFSDAKRMLEALYKKANASPLCKIMTAFQYLVRSCYNSVESTMPLVTAGQATPYWDPVHFKHKFYLDIHDLFMGMHHAMAEVGYRAVKDLDKKEKAAGEQDPPPSPPPAECNADTPAEHESSDQLVPNPDPAPSRSRKRPAEATVHQESNKKSKTDTGAGPSRSGKRPAEDAVEKESTKKLKRAPTPELSAAPRRSSRKKTGASSGAPRAAKAKAPAGKTKQAAEPPVASSSRLPSGSGSSSRQPSGTGTSAAGTSGQSAVAGPSRRPRTARPVASSSRVLRSSKKKSQ
ncbi:hypothetical protein BDZ89DRAFT_1072116 [Hymenopellis radicata]|nr:hypothetical protein BDZ89DRAFT_1072116 [Hymenopellis radicata]